MKLSNCLALAALTLSASAFAQTSQTFTFGEGQTTPNQGNSHAQPQAPHGQPSHALKRKTTHHKPGGHPATGERYSHG
ncbi:hypothetical protein [Paraburkholderia sp.]|uniref:hypothetical protein n=1 Tax=Paraburkholderia sp. TaxID=1926495 RepID=UPI002F420630